MIRQMSKQDLKHLLMIEHAVHLAPWDEKTFLACFKANCSGFVAIAPGQEIIGFIMISSYLNECHILNLAVLTDYQRKGYARKLLAAALNFAAHKKATMVYLEVRRSNVRAINLYQRAGFELIGERKEYYPLPTGHEDALVFAKSLLENTLHD